MKIPVVNILDKSIRKMSEKQIKLPFQKSKYTPDICVAFQNINQNLKAQKRQLVLSDLFRRYEIQYRVHLDYAAGKKQAYGLFPIGSMHEVMSAFDMWLDVIRKFDISLQQFWDIAFKYNVSPVIKILAFDENEVRHFSCHGSYLFTVSFCCLRMVVLSIHYN